MNDFIEAKTCEIMFIAKHNLWNKNQTKENYYFITVINWTAFGLYAAKTQTGLKLWHHRSRLIHMDWYTTQEFNKTMSIYHYSCILHDSVSLLGE